MTEAATLPAPDLDPALAPQVKDIAPEPPAAITPWSEDPRNPLKGIRGQWGDPVRWKPSPVLVDQPGNWGAGLKDIPSNWYKHPATRDLLAKGDRFQLAYDISHGDIQSTLETVYGFPPFAEPRAPKEVMVEDFMREHGAPRAWVEDNYQDLVNRRHIDNLMRLVGATRPDGRPVHPGLLEWMGNRDNAWSAKNKEEQLATLIRATEDVMALNMPVKGSLIRRAVFQMRSGGKDLARSAPAFGEAAYHQVWSLSKAVAEGLGAPGWALDVVTPPADWVPKWLSDIRTSPSLYAADSQADSWWGQVFDGFFRNMPQVAGNISLALAAGPVVASAWMGSFISGLTYDDLVASGVSPERAAWAANLNALIQMPLEYLPLAEALKFAKGSARGFRAMAAAVARTAGEEAGTEFMQEFVDAAAELFGESERHGKTLSEQFDWAAEEYGKRLGEYYERARLSAAIGALSGGVMTLGGAGINFAGRQIDQKLTVDRVAGKARQRAEEFAGKLDTAMEAAEDPKVKEMPAGAVEDAIRGAAEGESVVIEYDDLNSVFQARRMTQQEIRDVTDQLGITEQWEEAGTTGNSPPIVIDRAAYVARAGELHADLREHVAPDVDTAPLSRQDAVRARAQVEIKAVQDAIDQVRVDMDANNLPAEARELQRQFRDWGAQQGIGAEAVNSAFEVFLAQRAMEARQWGRTLEEHFKKENFQFVVGAEGPVIGSVGPAGQAGQADPLGLDIAQQVPVSHETAQAITDAIMAHPFTQGDVAGATSEYFKWLEQRDPARPPTPEELRSALPKLLGDAKVAQEVLFAAGIVERTQYQTPEAMRSQIVQKLGPGAERGLVKDETTGQLVFNIEEAVKGLREAEDTLYQGIESQVEGRFMRGTKAKTAPMAYDVLAQALSNDILQGFDQVATLAEARQKLDDFQYLEPTIDDSIVQNLRYKKRQTGMYGNDKMKFPNAAYTKGRSSWDIPGCGRVAWAVANGQDLSTACYGGACYAETLLRDHEGTSASIAGGVRKFSLRDKRLRTEIETYWKQNGLAATQEKYSQFAIGLGDVVDKNRLQEMRDYFAANGLKKTQKKYPYNVITVNKRSGKPKFKKLSVGTVVTSPNAIVTTRLKGGEGLDMRLGVDTDGAAWLANPKVMDAILAQNPNTVSVYASSYYTPPVPHPLSKRAIINVTVSGWHPIVETMSRIRYAEQARANGWNVILREVVADPAVFGDGIAQGYNRIHDALMQTDFFVMQQGLHVGSKYGGILWGIPACCVGSANNQHTCDQCEVSEGLGKRFVQYWGINEQADTPEETIFPDLGPRTYYQGEQRRALGATTFLDDKTVISLFKDANISTLLHESAHIYLNQLQAIVASGQATDQTQADLAALLEFAGGKFDRSGVEKVARAFEQYLREGNAPSSRLRDAFRRLWSWMVAVYKRAEDLGVEITDPVREVFSRSLASSQEIQAVEAERALGQNIEDLLGADQKRKNDLRKRREEARAQSGEKAASAARRDLIDAEQFRAQATREARARVISRPAMQHIADLIERGGLDAAEIEALPGGKQLLPEIQKHRRRIEGKRGMGWLAKRGGPVGLQEAADLLGYQSVEAMLDAFQKAETLSYEIKQETKTILGEIVERIKADQPPIDAAEEAYYSDEQLGVIQEEHAAITAELNRRGGVSQGRLYQRHIRDQAQKTLHDKPIRDALLYYRYAQAEKRFAREAIEAVQKGNLQAAEIAKYQQALNHALMLEAIRMRDEYLKNKKRWSFDRVKALLPQLEEDYKETALDMVRTFILNEAESQRPLEPYVPPATQTAEDRELFWGRIEGISDYVSDWIQTKSLPRGYDGTRDLTWNQLLQVKMAWDILIHRGKGTLIALKDLGYKSRAELAAAIINQIGQQEAKGYKEPETLRAKTWDKIRSGLIGFQKPLHVAEVIDGFPTLRGEAPGPLMQAILRLAYQDAAEINMRGASFKKLIEPMKVISGFVDRLSEQFGGHFLKKLDLPVSELRRDRRGQSHWTAERLAVLILYSGDPIARQSILHVQGEAWSDADLQRLLGLLTVAEVKAFNEVWAVLSEHFAALDDVNYQETGHRLQKTQAYPQTITTSDGQQATLTGGYVAKRHDPWLNNRYAGYKEKELQTELLRERKASAMGWGKTPSGMRQARLVDEHGRSLAILPLYLESLGVVQEMIQDQVHAVTHTTVVSELGQVLGRDSVKDAIVRIAGRDRYNVLKATINRAANPHGEALDRSDRFFNYLRGLSTVQILGGKFKVGVKQRLSYYNALRAMADAGPGAMKYVADALIEIGTLPSVAGVAVGERVQWILDQSKILRARMGTAGDREIRDFVKNMKLGIKIKIPIPGTNKVLTAQQVQELLFAWIKMNDTATVLPIWMACYNQARQEGLWRVKDAKTEEERHGAAIEYADFIIGDTQPITFPAYLSEMQAKKGGIVTFLMSFTSFLNVVGNRSMRYLDGWLRKDIEGKRYAGWDQISKHFLMEHVMPAWTMWMWSWALAALVYGPEDDPEALDLLLNPIGSVFAFIPVLRDIIPAYQYRADVGRIPAFEGPNRTVQTFISLARGKPFMRHMWRSLEFWTGLPVTNPLLDIEREYKAWARANEEK